MTVEQRAIENFEETEQQQKQGEETGIAERDFYECLTTIHTGLWRHFKS